MTPRRVYGLLIGILVCVGMLITGHMDLDWQRVSYYFDGPQNSWNYWEYCPFIRVQWWTAYLIQVLRISAGWLCLGWILNEIKHALGDSS